jgi:phage tail-like protein
MVEFTVNPTRVDPYKNFKFLIKFEGQTTPVAGLSKMSTLRRTTEVIKHRSGGDPSTSRKSPGRTEYDAITLERGVTQDTDFETWANKVWTLGNNSGSEVSLADFRRNLLLELLNEAGQVVMAYKIYRCWISEYQALPVLDANETKVAIQSIRIENEGWERDANVPEPKEPTVSVPG